MRRWSPPPTGSRPVSRATDCGPASASRYGCRAGSRPRSRCWPARATAMSAARRCTATTRSTRSSRWSIGCAPPRSSRNPATAPMPTGATFFADAGRPRFPALRLAGRAGRARRRSPICRDRQSTGRPSGDPNQIIYLAFTSGTTGAPKGVLHSDNTLLAIRAHDGARLAARARRALHAEPAEPQSRARRLDHRAGGRRRAGRARSAARREPARPAGRDGRRLRVRRADPRASICWPRSGRAASGGSPACAGSAFPAPRRRRR